MNPILQLVLLSHSNSRPEGGGLDAALFYVLPSSCLVHMLLPAAAVGYSWSAQVMMTPSVIVSFLFSYQ